MSNDLTLVTKPLEIANGLPNSHYIDQSVYELEKRSIFFEGWPGLCVASEVPKIGDAIPISFMGMPLLVLRGKQGEVRVFQNICRHRGMILVKERKNIEGAIRCPYHSWCYSTEGNLLVTPHVGGPGINTHPDIDKNTLGLIEVRSYIWRDVIFINISGDAEPFETIHKNLMTRWKEFEQPLFHGGEDSKFLLDVKCNWKLAVENYCESYHLPWIHPGLNTYSKLEDHYNINEPNLYSGQGSLLYRQFLGDNGAVFPNFADLSDKWTDGAEYITVYPNVLLAVQKDHVYATIISPTSTTTAEEHMHIYYASSDTDPKMRKDNCKQWEEIFIEDIFVVEGMQTGRQCSGFDGGRFSPAMDGPTHCFHAWVANKLLNFNKTVSA
ncbi:MAG: aromatic ring-hydroxylating dioxygenase subunit alpha [Proteobacteria bacterium]|jgi:choline monooxygenase|nr:aromatic ring-hydroxylating dioxygenase subunit alpha [Pseudomonadota bacterium]MDA1237987.1 aromatic ring-hydroxylating dioxygenase subunit alpha [Pseudomonadota bacterium]